MDFVDSLWGRPNTIKTQRCLFNRWVWPMVRNPKKWMQMELDRAATFWIHEGLAPRTVKSLLSLTVRYIKYEGGMELNPAGAQKAVMRLQQQEAPKALSKEDASKLIATCKKYDTSLYGPLLFALHTGMRKGEVFGLQHGDIDILKGTVTVNRSYDGPTKNGRSRIINVSKELEDFILDIFPLKTYNKMREKVIFKHFDPNPRLKAMCRKAGIRLITFHSMRHTFATLALEAGRSPKQVSEALGHSNLSTTLDLYWSTTEKLDMGFV